MNNVAVINKKGGVGKTPIATSLGIDLNYFIISNDDSTIEQLYPDQAKVMDTPVLVDNAVYDFGGFADDGVLDIIEHCEVVLIPCTNTPNAIQRTYQTIKELREDAMSKNITLNIAVVVTKTTNENDFDEVKKLLSQHFDGIQYFELMLSKAFSHQEQTGWSISQVIDENHLSKYAYRKLKVQYEALLEYVKSFQKGE